MFNIKELSQLNNVKHTAQASVIVLHFGSTLTVKITKFSSLFIFVKRRNIVRIHHNIKGLPNHLSRHILCKFCIKRPSTIAIELLNIHFSTFTRTIRPNCLSTPFTALPDTDNSAQRYSKHSFGNLVITIYKSGVITSVCSSLGALTFFL